MRQKQSLFTVVLNRFSEMERSLNTNYKEGAEEAVSYGQTVKQENITRAEQNLWSMNNKQVPHFSISIDYIDGKTKQK